MNPKIKLPYAKRNGKLIHISEMPSGRHDDCLCPGCEKPLIAKKGNLITHHFAHDPGSTCNLESALHWIGKMLLFSQIKAALKTKRPIPMIWKCTECFATHKGNLLKKAVEARMEYDLRKAKADILLFDGKGIPVVAIEIIVSHPPDPTVIAFYRASNIAIVQIRIENVADLETLRDMKVLKPSAANVCSKSKCPKCGEPTCARYVHVATINCYRCGNPMQICWAETEHIFHYDKSFSNPTDFTEKDRESATARGCIIKSRSGVRLKANKMANYCGRCDAFIGDIYLMEHSKLGRNASIETTGWYCPFCAVMFDHNSKPIA